MPQKPEVVRLHISGASDTPHQTVKRQIGRVNDGLYCANDECREFFALAVEPEKSKPIAIEFISDGMPTFKCPFCGTVQKRNVEQIKRFVLTEGQKKRK